MVSIQAVRTVLVHPVQHVKITRVAAFCDPAFLHRSADGAARFILVQAIVEASAAFALEHFGELVTDLLGAHVHQTEAFDAGRVDDESGSRKML